MVDRRKENLWKGRALVLLIFFCAFGLVFLAMAETPDNPKQENRNFLLIWAPLISPFLTIFGVLAVALIGYGYLKRTLEDFGRGISALWDKKVDVPTCQAHREGMGARIANLENRNHG